MFRLENNVTEPREPFVIASAGVWGVTTQQLINIHETARKEAREKYRAACSARCVAYGQLIGAQLRGDPDAETDAWAAREAAMIDQENYFDAMNYHDAMIARYQMLLNGNG